MEIQLSLLAITFSLFFLLHYCLAKYYKPKIKLPPGPTKLPIIGNLHQLAKEDPLPHRSLQKLAKKYGPLMHLQLGEVSALVVTSPRLAKEITKTHDLAFAQRPQFLVAKTLTYGLSDLIFAPYGDNWRQLRKICMLELLSHKRVQSFSSLRESETAKFIESIRESAGSSVNLTRRVSSMICYYVLKAAFGDRCSKQDYVDEFLHVAKTTIEMSGGFYLADLYPSIKPLYYITGMKSKVEKLHRKADMILENIVAEHQEKQSRGGGGVVEEDLVDILLKFQQSSGLSNHIAIRNTKAVILDIFIAGTDTTGTTIVWAMSELIRNPRVMKKAQAELRETFKGKNIINDSDVEELSYLKSVIKETLRLHAPTPLLLPRECMEHTIIDGYDIPVKTRVMINVWAMARDPQYWSDAESFIPERFDNDNSIDFKANNFEYLPFGAGRRICPGMTFGIASIILPLAQLLYHFDWELPDGMKPQDLDMSEQFGIAIERKTHLCLVPTLYI